MKLIIPGLARTGTRSLWRFFQAHPEVSTSKDKEPLRLNKNLDDYIKNFDLDAEFGFDGTPELTNYPVIHQLIRLKEIEKIYQIWFTRCPIERFRSVIKRFARLSDEDLLTLPKYVLDIDMKSQLDKAGAILGKENILVTSFREKDVERHIENWLGIKNTELKLPWDKH